MKVYCAAAGCPPPSTTTASTSPSPGHARRRGEPPRRGRNQEEIDMVFTSQRESVPNRCQGAVSGIFPRKIAVSSVFPNLVLERQNPLPHVLDCVEHPFSTPTWAVCRTDRSDRLA